MTYSVPTARTLNGEVINTDTTINMKTDKETLTLLLITSIIKTM